MSSHLVEEREGKVPLIAHVIFRLDIGGLENGLVNLINEMPAGMYRHAIICITSATAFRQRIKARDVTIIELNKKPGKDFALYWRFLRVIRKLRPDVIHTRNFNTLEFQPIAALAGVHVRIHGEHGWDVHDLYGTSRKYRIFRKALRPFVDRFVVVSQGLHDYLTQSIRVSADKIALIRNGVDTRRFRPRRSIPAADKSTIVIGTIGRMQEVKNQRLLVQAFVNLINRDSEKRSDVRLLMIGDGPLREKLIDELNSANMAEFSTLPGACDNIHELLREIDIFVLPSRNEGISNTILEAMATGLPVIAARVGGNPEIVQDGVTGILIGSDEIEELTAALLHYVERADMRETHGNAGRKRACLEFSIDLMVGKYLDVYSQSLC